MQSANCILLFSDALRSHMFAYVVNKLFENKLAVMALPLQTGNLF